jgi:hypothetical protein
VTTKSVPLLQQHAFGRSTTMLRVKFRRCHLLTQHQPSQLLPLLRHWELSGHTGHKLLRRSRLRRLDPRLHGRFPPVSRQCKPPA